MLQNKFRPRIYNYLAFVFLLLWKSKSKSNNLSFSMNNLSYKYSEIIILYYICLISSRNINSQKIYIRGICYGLDHNQKI